MPTRLRLALFAAFLSLEAGLLPIARGVAADAPAAPETDPFAKWEKSIAEFETQDKTQPPPKNAVLFVGSSSIRLWKLPTYFGDLPTVNRGFGGSVLPDSTHFADRIVIPHKPRLVVLYAGDNDIARNRTAEQVASDFAAFAAKIHASLPETKIAFIGVKPSLARWKNIAIIRDANARIAAQCAKDPRLIFVDVDKPMLGADGLPRPELYVKDGLHLSHEGYLVWTEQLKPVLK